MITFKSRGDFQHTEKFLNRMSKRQYLNILSRYGDMGVNALASATPKDSGRTASAWRYEISGGRGNTTITFVNDNTNRNVNIAIILQYGHGTGTGGYVQGRDYINPAIQPIFDKITEELWREVTAV